MSYWIKLYLDILDDKKVAKLSDWQFRVFMLCLLHAKELDDNGQLATISDIAWRLRAAEKPIEDALRAMRTVGIVDENERGWYIVNFAKRQAGAGDNAERVRAFRERQKEKKKQEDVTNVTLHSSPLLSSDSSSSLTDAEFKTVYTFYSSNFGALTSFVSDEIKVAVEDFTAEWVNEAMKEAVKNEARNWKYVEAILKNWKTHGFKAQKPGGNGRKPDQPMTHKVPTTQIVPEPGWHP